MYTVEYAFSSTHDLDDEFWESKVVDNLEEAAEIISRTNPPKWEVFDDLNYDHSAEVKRMIKKLKNSA